MARMGSHFLGARRSDLFQGLGPLDPRKKLGRQDLHRDYNPGPANIDLSQRRVDLELAGDSRDGATTALETFLQRNAHGRPPAARPR